MIRDNKVLIAQLESMYPQVKFLFIGVASLTFVLLYVFWNKVETTFLLSWAMASTLVIVIRATFVVYSVKFLNMQNAHIHALIFALGCLASGMIWAFTSFLFLNTHDTISLIVVVILLLGSTAGSLVTLSAYLPAFYAYNVTILSPLAWVLIAQDNPDIVWIGILVVVFLIAMIGYSHSVNRSLKQYISLRFTNEKLLIEARKQRDIAEQANIEKSRYLAATSHDLRQPLHALQLYLSNLELLQTTSEQKLLMSKAINTSDNLHKLLSALMDVSRLDSGDVEVNIDSNDLGTLINNLAEEFIPLAQSQQIKFSIDSPHLYAYTDAVLLTRCLRNLVCNAFDHAQASEIDISIKNIDEKHLEICVSDNGLGISHLEKENIFSEFYQLKNPERDRTKGLGLGLAIVKKLTVLLNHPLNLTTHLGAGCQFSITLERSTLLPIACESSTDHIDLSGLFIVVVDDDPDICDAMGMTLKQWGCEIIVSNSTQALLDEFEHLNYTAPDIIIADYRLKNNKTGLATIESVREYFKCYIPSILVSGDSSPEILKAVENLKCDFQHKPVSATKLKRAVQNITTSHVK